MGAKEWISEFFCPHSPAYRFGFREASLRHAVHLLGQQPAVADSFARGTQDHRPEPMTVFSIMLLIPSRPVLHPRLIKRGRIKPHDLRIAENAQQRRNVVRVIWRRWRRGVSMRMDSMKVISQPVYRLQIGWNTSYPLGLATTKETHLDAACNHHSISNLSSKRLA